MTSSCWFSFPDLLGSGHGVTGAVTDPYGLHVAELADAVGAELPPVARPLDPAEGQLRVRGRGPVHEDHPRLEIPDEPVLLLGIPGPHAGAQTVLRDVGEPEGVVDVAEAVELGDG